MSKSSELKTILYGRSIDAPINYHHRTGDIEGSGGNMLDLYAQEDSAEDVYFDGEDERAKVCFLKGFKGYLRKVYNRTEREFLSRLMSGREKPHEVGRALGVDWFKYMQSLQHKAYKNIKPLLRLTELAGWTRAEEFTAIILRRLSLINAGAELAELLPNVANRGKVREALKGAGAKNAEEKRAHHSFLTRRWIEKNSEHLRKWRETNKEKRLEQKKAYREANKEKIRIYRKAYRETHKEKIKADRKKYRETHKEKNSEYMRKWRETNKEKRLEQQKAYREVNKENIRAYDKAYRETHKEKISEYKRKWREANKEKTRAYDRAYRKAAKLAAEAIALETIAGAIEAEKAVSAT